MSRRSCGGSRIVEVILILRRLLWTLPQTRRTARSADPSRTNETATFLGLSRMNHPLRGHTAAPLERALVQLKGQARVRSLKECLQREQRQSDLARRSELCNPEQTRSWLWSINKAVDPCLEPRLYSVAVRLMLGAEFVSGGSLCGGCGKTILDSQASLATCCHSAAVTIGHHRIRDVLAMCFAVADPATVIELAGLVHSKPTL